MSTSRERFLSLDVFRGMTVCFMIIVNTAGYGAKPYAPLEHAHWFGFTPTDLVFPSFLFAVGNALAFSLHKFEGRSVPYVLSKILRRVVLIFLVGFLMYWFPFFHTTPEGWAMNPIGHTRIFGVLQRIALCYGIAAMLAVWLPRKGIFWTGAVLLFAYWILLYAFGQSGHELEMQGNAGSVLDYFLLGENHMYHGEGIAFEPEGLLSTLPSVVNVLAGYLAGDFIRRKGKTFECIAMLMIAGAVLLFFAWFWGLVFPIGKKLWTSPFVLLTVGLDLLILPVLIYLVELRNWKRGVYFFTVFGKNPLFVYLVSELLVIIFWMIGMGNDQSFYQWINLLVFQKIAPGPFGALLFSVAFMLLCWFTGYLLDRKKLYVRL
ncbi:MAG: DUF5009 domain-containing protein [Mucilaginibacter polytrichastri]|nr:DUF5009 domain-containing protein [Mucilaginibacter polytrichastri]